MAVLLCFLSPLGRHDAWAGVRAVLDEAAAFHGHPHGLGGAGDYLAELLDSDSDSDGGGGGGGGNDGRGGGVHVLGAGGFGILAPGQARAAHGHRLGVPAAVRAAVSREFDAVRRYLTNRRVIAELRAALSVPDDRVACEALQAAIALVAEVGTGATAGTAERSAVDLAGVPGGESVRAPVAAELLRTARALLELRRARLARRWHEVRGLATARVLQFHKRASIPRHASIPEACLIADR